MRTNLDFSPLFRSSIGFDRMLGALQAGIDTIDNWPPYDILKRGDDESILLRDWERVKNDVSVSIQRSPAP